MVFLQQNIEIVSPGPVTDYVPSSGTSLEGYLPPPVNQQ